ncbi:hypothetical protein G6F37_008378 [Rhizopus arrhizus]|nr:hypothetical protein G6F38_008323 [Rhizopus arrhizus]KAG1155620.1 hypothetical protein G6F37_008378 [Rhizopus arrhizus]
MNQKVPKEEQAILENLINIRARLSAVKRDRSTYLKLDDIMPLRLETEEQMKKLSAIRGGRLLDESRELNRTDDVLDEILQILSLCFLSLGRVKEISSVYSQVITIKHIFDRLNEAGVYEEEYLHPYKTKLDEIEKILVQDTKNDIVPEYAIQVLRYKFIQCGKIYENLLNTIREVDDELIPIRDRMLRIRRNLSSICCKKEYTPDDIKPLQDELHEIDDLRVDGKFLGPNETTPPGQGVLVSLLEQLYYLSHDVIFACSEDFSPALQSIRERLLEIKGHLERLELTHKWTLRQTDLFTYQHQLYDIVKLKYNYMNYDEQENPELFGKFINDQGIAPEGQSVLDFLLHKCYRMIFELLNESTPVSEALTPVYNQLTSVRQCLSVVKKMGAPCSAEELYPYQMKLSSIDDLRKDGKFYDDRGNIPEGAYNLRIISIKERVVILNSLRDESESNASTPKLSPVDL